MEVTEKIKYDTTVLLNRIKELVAKGKYSSYTALGDKLAYETGISPAHARRIFRGQYAPNEKVKEELLKLLELDDQDILNIGWGKLKKATIRKHKKVQIKHSTASKAVSEFSKDYRFNADKFEKLREDKGLSKMDVCTILGVSTPAPFYQWERGLTFPSEVNLNKLAALFSVDREEFLIPRKVEMPSGDTENTPKTAETEEKQNVMPGLFKEIGDEQNIHKIFEIINNNILTLAAEMSKCTKLQEDRFGKLNGELEEIKRSVEAITDAGAEKVQTIVATVKPKAVSKKKAETVVEISVDGYDYWRSQINAYISKIVKRNPGSTYKQVLSNFYTRLTNEYGANMLQLEKDFVAEKGHKAQATLEYVWFNQIFREIFMNIIKDEANR